MLNYVMIASLMVYALASATLLIYGAHLYVMLGLFYWKQKRRRAEIKIIIDDFYRGALAKNLPFVTVQLPVYNESDVVARLIKSAAKLDYPKDRFEIQVIDDSVDDTVALIDKIVAELRQSEGVDISVIRRGNREHFKAGALSNALNYAKGEYAAIFDSDFVIPEYFLKRAIAQIHSDAKVACVQGRWGHINRHENWLTRAQSIGIDGHFAAEQGARSYNNLCMNFNGTAGVWRISAIRAIGGWSGDTLTEDLGLSYRAQLAGYKISYDFDLVCLAELPNNITALKSQQKRWAKGSMETAIKLMPDIIRSKTLSFGQKLEAFIHLTHYSVSLLMVVLAIFTLPVLLLAPALNIGVFLPALWVLIIISAMAPCVLYTGCGAIHKKGLFSFAHFPAMLAVGTGLCVNNALAVLEAFIGSKSEFVRTPKSGSSDTNKRSGSYRANTKILPALLEVVLGVYCSYTFLVYLGACKYLFGFFIGAYAFGLIVFGSETLVRLLASVVSGRKMAT